MFTIVVADVDGATPPEPKPLEPPPVPPELTMIVCVENTLVDVIALPLAGPPAPPPEPPPVLLPLSLAPGTPVPLAAPPVAYAKVYVVAVECIRLPF